MSRFKHHVFVCTNERPPGEGRPDCAGRAGREVLDRLRAGAFERALVPQVRINETGCLGQCAQGCSVVVYPEGVWYGGVRPEDADTIIEEHLAAGRPVERLRSA